MLFKVTPGFIRTALKVRVVGKVVLMSLAEIAVTKIPKCPYQKSK